MTEVKNITHRILRIPLNDGGSHEVKLGAGETLFLLGANGSGKSLLLHNFHSQCSNISAPVHRIVAHRQTWMASNRSPLSLAQYHNSKNILEVDDYAKESRCKDYHASSRVDLSLFDIVDKVNARARRIARAVDSCDKCALEIERSTPALTESINGFFNKSNFQITLSIAEDQQLMVKKNSGAEYAADELSDGERSALLMLIEVLTKPGGTIFLLDEPERHLHSSISAPLLFELVSQRKDCYFVISTHDLMMSQQFTDASVYVLRSVNFNNIDDPRWDFDILPSDGSVDTVLKQDLLGSRQTILFVEGDRNSLDYQFYNLLFHMATVIPKGNRRMVEDSVRGLRDIGDRFWTRCFGIIDGDGFYTDASNGESEQTIYQLPFYSIESLYLLEGVIEMVAQEQTDITGKDVEDMKTDAINKVMQIASNRVDQLGKKVAKRRIWRKIDKEKPGEDDVLEVDTLNITVPSKKIYEMQSTAIRDAVDNGDWETLLKICPIHEVNAINEVSRILGFQRTDHYIAAVHKYILGNESMLHEVRGYFGDLYTKLLQQGEAT